MALWEFIIYNVFMIPSNTKHNFFLHGYSICWMFGGILTQTSGSSMQYIFVHNPFSISSHRLFQNTCFHSISKERHKQNSGPSDSFLRVCDWLICYSKKCILVSLGVHKPNVLLESSNSSAGSLLMTFEFSLILNFKTSSFNFESLSLQQSSSKLISIDLNFPNHFQTVDSLTASQPWTSKMFLQDFAAFFPFSLQKKNITMQIWNFMVIHFKWQWRVTWMKVESLFSQEQRRYTLPLQAMPKL